MSPHGVPDRLGHALVTGRFCPPHAGHHHLVRTARARCARLTVLVRGSAADPLPLDDRVAWLREIHPDALVLGADASTDLRTAVPEPVDAVLTAEPYGTGPARALGAAHVTVDRLPVSTAAVRAEPARHWDLLEAPVRAALTRRVVVLGAESTGATTLVRALADHYRRRGGVWARTRYVPDDTPDRSALRSADYPVLALRRAEREETAARAGSPVLFCDGDAFAATIRHERYLGTTSPGTGEIAARGRAQLWLVTDHRGVPAGEPRTADEELLRAWTTARLLTRLARTGRPAAVLTGPHEERLATAVAAVDALLAERPLLAAAPVPEHR